MIRYFNSSIGRLRLYAFLEGVSLLALVFVAMPVKYFFDNPALVRSIGPVHGALFLLFVFGAVTVGVEQNWKFAKTTWLVLLASFIPFGTFYLDAVLLKKLHNKQVG